MAAQFQEKLAGVGFPQAGEPLAAARQDQAPVGTKRCHAHGPLVIRHRRDEIAACRVPEAGVLVDSVAD